MTRRWFTLAVILFFSASGSYADDSAPLDPSLRVRGVGGLRVVDASVMPMLPSANTFASTIGSTKASGHSFRTTDNSPSASASLSEPT